MRGGKVKGRGGGVGGMLRGVVEVEVEEGEEVEEVVGEVEVEEEGEMGEGAVRGGLVAVVGEGVGGRLGEEIRRMEALEMGGEDGGGRGVERGLEAGVGEGVGMRGLRVGVWKGLFWLGVKEERRGVRGEEVSGEMG